MFDKLRRRKEDTQNLTQPEESLGSRAYGKDSLEQFAKEVMNYGIVQNGTVEKLGVYFESFHGALKRVYSLTSDEIESKQSLRDGRGDRSWVYELRQNISGYEQTVKILSHSGYSTYDTCKISVKLVEEFFNKVGRRSGAIGNEVRSDTKFGIGLNENLRELMEVDRSIGGLWNRNRERERKFANLVEKLYGRHILMEELSAKIRRAKQEADGGDTAGIGKVKQIVRRISLEEEYARNSLLSVQAELEMLFKPINGRVSEKYDYEFRFDRHSLGNFIRNNKEILEHFDIFVAKVKSLRGMLIANKLDLDEKLRHGALVATERILEKSGERSLETAPQGVSCAESGPNLQSLIKKERGLAEYIVNKGDEIRSLGSAMERIREPILSATKQVETLIEEQREVQRKIASAQEAIKKYVFDEYKITVDSQGDELILKFGVATVKRQ